MKLFSAILRWDEGKGESVQNGELPADTFFPIPDYVTTGEGVEAGRW